MAFSQATLVQRTRDLLQDNPWASPFVANLASTTSTTVAVSDGTIWDVGAIGEWQDNGEQFYTRSVSVNNLTVIRGYNGTTATTHDGSGTPIVILRDPVFQYSRVVDSIALTMQSLWPYVYKKVTATVTPVNNQIWYDLAAAALALIHVSQVDTTPTPVRYYEYGSKGSRLPVGLKFNVPTTLAASGTSICFPRGFATQVTTVQVDYAAKITATVGTGNYSDISDGILADCIAHGAAARLLVVSEIPRVSNDDVNMGDASVVPGQRSAAARSIWAQYMFLRNMYHEELRRTMPLMGGGTGSAYTTGFGGYGGPGVPYP